MRIEDWQAIIFDFDGVIVESGDIKTQAFAELYRPYGEHVVTEVVRYHQQNGGMSRYLKFRYFQQHLLHNLPLTEEEEQVLDRRFSGLVIEAVIASQAVPGAELLLQKAAERIPLFIASGTPENELKTIVERRNLSHFFKEVRGSPLSKQTLIANILTAYSLVPERVLMIGDAMADYQGATLNGTAFLGRVRPNDANPFPAHVKTVPDLCSLVI